MEPLAAVTRNDYIESIHYGYVCITESSGNILYNLGDSKTKIFFRSTAKPIQVIPLISSGAAEQYGFTQKEIALSCSSHSGREIHRKTVQEILKKLDLHEENLHCGIMTPYDEEERKKLELQGSSPSVYHCSCSGKHSAMLALAKYKGYNLNDYEKITNPLQQEILKTIADFTEEEASKIPVGTDGCGTPIYLLPIVKIALSYSKLSLFSQDIKSFYHYPCKNIFDSMTGYPEMVAGDNEFCTQLMRVTGNRLIAKVGCEAVYCIGVKEGNLGICVKIADGNERALYPVIIHILKELDIISSNEIKKLDNWYSIILKNNLNEPIGKIVPVFSLKNNMKNRINLGSILKDAIDN